MAEVINNNNVQNNEIYEEGVSALDQNSVDYAQPPRVNSAPSPPLPPVRHLAPFLYFFPDGCPIAHSGTQATCLLDCGPRWRASQGPVEGQHSAGLLGLRGLVYDGCLPQAEAGYCQYHSTASGLLHWQDCHRAENIKNP